jgi:4'-phosphopantetheinyl transferase
MQPSGAIDVWVADLSGVPESLLSVLCEQERERASRLLDERAAVYWSASRAVLRDLLGRATGQDPAMLRFELGPHGKPELGCFFHGVLHFNLSHSGTLALYALSREREVGVDIEIVDRGRSAARDEVAIARRMLGDEVADRLAEMDPDQRHREFLAAWVAYEAIVKCSGGGLGEGETLAHARQLDAKPRPAPWATAIDVGEQALAALAVQGGEAVVRLRWWREL